MMKPVHDLQKGRELGGRILVDKAVVTRYDVLNSAG